MTKGDRAELRSLIKARFRVLRADVRQREAELLKELERRLAQEYADDDSRWATLAFQVEQLALEANRAANDAVRQMVGRDQWPSDAHIIRTVQITQIRCHHAATSGQLEQHQTRRNGQSAIEAKVRDALLHLDRTETDLLERLVTGALESDEAKQFLRDIPTVAQLIPTDRLLALEQALEGR